MFELSTSCLSAWWMLEYMHGERLWTSAPPGPLRKEQPLELERSRGNAFKLETKHSDALTVLTVISARCYLCQCDETYPRTGKGLALRVHLLGGVLKGISMPRVGACENGFSKFSMQQVIRSRCLKDFLDTLLKKVYLKEFDAAEYICALCSERNCFSDERSHTSATLCTRMPRRRYHTATMQAKACVSDTLNHVPWMSLPEP
jgi:hypothetical protein